MGKLVDRFNNEVWATIRPSKIHGVGIFAIRDIPKGIEIGKGCEETSIYYELSDDDFIQLLEPIRNIILDRTQQGDIIRFRHPNCMAKLQSFMNHSLTPNSDGKITLVDIKKDEEITENFLTLNKTKLHKFIIERYINEGIIK